MSEKSEKRKCINCDVITKRDIAMIKRYCEIKKYRFVLDNQIIKVTTKDNHIYIYQLGHTPLYSRRKYLIEVIYKYFLAKGRRQSERFKQRQERTLKGEITVFYYCCLTSY